MCRADRLDALLAAHGLNRTAAAERIGCSRLTLRRALAGEPVSAEFIAACTTTFSTTFDALFVVGRRTAA